MKDIQGFGTKYSPYQYSQISTPTIPRESGRRLISYDEIAERLLSLCQNDDIKTTMKRNTI